ncbi:hypothetical protein UUU_16830 [Klebsiella pneumoniae subsp. pneumoniae DSM 30104 = JCM 1662 = NBRC 14940]|nr:hypothetical protein UUU_16830 [Klebsiella pneumoniae subsp. pneumoniae DSM 30104 = JCM 1662 = NBRC 14940]
MLARNLNGNNIFCSPYSPQTDFLRITSHSAMSNKVVVSKKT